MALPMSIFLESGLPLFLLVFLRWTYLKILNFSESLRFHQDPSPAPLPGGLSFTVGL